MKGKIDFRYDPQNDVVVATPHWRIETETDVRVWYEQYVRYMKAWGRRMDFVVVLDDFHISPGIGPFWGEYRAKLHQQFTRFNYRVHSNNLVKLFVNTSGVRYNVATQEAASVEDAILGIQAARAASLPVRAAG